MWTILFGWWISVAYFFVAALLYCTVVAAPQARLCVALAKYYFWPFGSFVIAQVCLCQCHSELMLNSCTACLLFGWLCL
jgi:uncharacterized membrane protein YccF (DUF307 family)